MTIGMVSAVIKLYFHRAFSNVMITEIFVTNTGEKEIKNFRFSVSACEVVVFFYLYNNLISFVFSCRKHFS